MMKRGAHLNFVHFWGGGARLGESSVHVARELGGAVAIFREVVSVPFEPVQWEIGAVPEEFCILLYRRMMLRIAERVARSNRALGLITGDSLVCVTRRRYTIWPPWAPQCMPLPSAGGRRQNGNHGCRAQDRHVRHFCGAFHDCCPIFLAAQPRTARVRRGTGQAERAGYRGTRSPGESMARQSSGTCCRTRGKSGVVWPATA